MTKQNSKSSTPAVVQNQVNVTKNIDLKITQSDMLDIMVQDALQEYAIQLSVLEAAMAKHIQSFLGWYEKNMAPLHEKLQFEPTKAEKAAALALGMGKFSHYEPLESVILTMQSDESQLGMQVRTTYAIHSPEKDAGNYDMLRYSTRFFDNPIIVEEDERRNMFVDSLHKQSFNIPIDLLWIWEHPETEAQRTTNSNGKDRYTRGRGDTFITVNMLTAKASDLKSAQYKAAKRAKEVMPVTPARLKKLIAENVSYLSAMAGKMKEHHQLWTQRQDLERRPGKYKAKFTRAALQSTDEGAEILTMIQQAKDASRGIALIDSQAAASNKI